MIGTLEAVFLGIIQGLSEFIPISSTAHLRVIPAFLEMKDPGAAYSAVIQLGTLFSLLLYFRDDLFRFAKSSTTGLFSGRPFEEPDARMAWYLILGTVPISVIGLLFKDFIVGPARSLYVISASLIGLAVLLWLVDRFSNLSKNMEEVTWKTALWVGFAQSLALIPGSSRAGTTLTMGMFLGFTREAAMRFSFLLSIPAIGLSGVYELIQEREHLAALGFEGLFVGTMTAFVVGYLAIAGLLRYLKTHSTLVFVIYRIALGVLILILLQGGWIVDEVQWD